MIEQSIQRSPSCLSPMRRLRLKAVANSNENISFTKNMEKCKTQEKNSPLVQESASSDNLDNNNNLCKESVMSRLSPENVFEAASKTRQSKSPSPHKCSMPRKTQRSVSIHSGVLPTPDSNILRDSVSGKIYKRGRLLGKGGFARVYEGTEMGSNKKVAIKVIDKSRVVRSPQKEKVNLEIELHEYLATGHPNVVHFENSFENGKNICIVLELCERKSIAQYLRNKDVMSEKEVSDIMYGIIAGVGHLHNSGVIHRDLKLGNILLSQDMSVKVGDLGLATRSAWAKKKTICGTPNFIAPEVLLRQGHGPESDVWAIGCIMYTLLVGKPPFEAASLGETYRRILKNKYRIPATVSVEAANLIRFMLRTKPHTRPTVFELTKHQFFVKNQTQLRFPSVDILTKKYAPEVTAAQQASCPLLRKHRASTPSIMTSQQKSVRHVSCPTTSYYYDGGLSTSVNSYNCKRSSATCEATTSSATVTSTSITSAKNSSHTEANMEKKVEETKATSLEAIDIKVPEITVTSPPRNVNITRRNTVAATLQQPKVEKKKQAWKFIEKCVTKGSKITTGSPIKKLANKLQKLKTTSPKSNSDVTLNQSDNRPSANDVAQTKQTWVTKWVDYSNRYGFGYQIDDGRICVLFNDGAHMALLADGSTVEYIAAETQKVSLFQISSPPPEFSKLAKVLLHFVTYMTNNLEEAQKPTGSATSARLVTWSRTNLFVAMYLSDGTMQVNFCKDHVKINISSINDEQGIVVTYMNEDREKSSYAKSDLGLLAAQTNIVDRLSLVHDEFHLLLPDTCCPQEALCGLYRSLTTTTTDQALIQQRQTVTTAN